MIEINTLLDDGCPHTEPPSESVPWSPPIIAAVELEASKLGSPSGHYAVFAGYGCRGIWGDREKAESHVKRLEHYGETNLSIVRYIGSYAERLDGGKP